MTAAISTRQAQVRPLRRDDVAEVVDLVRRQAFAHEHPPEVLGRLFDYAWSTGGADTSFVLTSDDRIVGCLLGISSERVFEGQAYRVCQSSTWYVEPEFRGVSLQLLAAQMALKEYTITNLTASPEVGRMLERIGFEVVSRNRLFFGPLAGPARRALSPGGARILDTPREIEGVVAAEHRTILSDHLPHGCGHYVVRRGEAYCYVVTKRRPLKGEWFLPRWLPAGLRWRTYPMSDLMFLSDPEIALDHWGRLRRHIQRRERTIGLTVEESFLGPGAPRATRIPHPLYVFRRRTPVRSIDTLYSEFVLLPI
jgi:hypothetical protein